MATLLVGSEKGGTICSRSFYHTSIVGQLTDAVNPLSSAFRANVFPANYQSCFWINACPRHTSHRTLSTPLRKRSAELSTEPRMSKSGPLRPVRVGHSPTFVALTCELTPASHRLLNPAAPEAPLCWGEEWLIFINCGWLGPPVMERAVPMGVELPSSLSAERLRTGGTWTSPGGGWHWRRLRPQH
jgi:hypothetical protein